LTQGEAVSEEPCQCPDCQRFYREHDRLIRENPSLRQQQELNWAALQSFRTLAGRVLEELQKQHGDADGGPLAGSGVPQAAAESSRKGAVADNEAEGDAERIVLHSTGLDLSQTTTATRGECRNAVNRAIDNTAVEPPECIRKLSAEAHEDEIVQVIEVPAVSAAVVERLQTLCHAAEERAAVAAEESHANNGAD
jgi:hypothetical protein